MTGQEYPAHPPNREHRLWLQAALADRGKTVRERGRKRPGRPPAPWGQRGCALGEHSPGAAKMGGTTKYRDFYALVP